MAKKKTTLEMRGQMLVEYAEKMSKEVDSWVEINNLIFGPGGKASELFTTREERSWLTQSDYRKQLDKITSSLAESPEDPFGQIYQESTGKIALELSKSLHAALKIEAKEEGVSVRRLIELKCAMQLKALVHPG
ncbi:MAG: hypothetical protein CMJ46_16160 [Planctomyces sp.]|nr:hypothetical protein [Planctomyces sp.]